MSNKARRFEQSSGWISRPSGVAQKGVSRKAGRTDLSEGSRRMADGGSPGSESVMHKERLLVQFRRLKTERKIGETVPCPLCKQAIKATNFESHLRKTH